MKKLYNNILYLRALMLIMLVGLFAFSANAQSITINSSTATALYPFDTYEVDYTATGYPAGTTYYLILDVNGNGYFDAVEDNEDIIIDSSTNASGILDGSLPNIGGNSYDVYIVAAEDGTIGEVISETFSVGIGATSGTLGVGYPYSFDQDMVERSATTTTQDLTSDDYFVLIVDVTATDVVPANDLVVEVSTNGTDYSALTDQQGNSSFSAFDGELIFALSQTLNTTTVTFRVVQNNSASIAAATETWSLNSIDYYEYSGTLVQYDEQYVDFITINNPVITIDADSYGDYVGEDISVEYSSDGFTSGANFYLFTNEGGEGGESNLIDLDNRIVLGSATTNSAIIEETWPFDMGGETWTLYVAGFYGDVDDPNTVYFDGEGGQDELLNVAGSDEDPSGSTLTFDLAGARSAATNPVDLSSSTNVTLEINVSGAGAANPLLVQYSTNGTTWTNLEARDGSDEIDAGGTYEYDIEGGALSATTRLRVVQESTESAGVNTWSLNWFEVRFYEFVTSQFVDTRNVFNYSVTVNDIEDFEATDITGGTIYPGDEITVNADRDGFDLSTDISATADYTVVIDNRYTLDDAVVSIDGVTEEISITGTIPTTLEYGNYDVAVKVFDGSSPLIGLDVDVFDDFDVLEDLAIVGDDEVEEGDTDASFTLAGDRSLTTPAIDVESTDDLTISFYLDRLSGALSPAGTDIMVQVNADGGGFIDIASFNINDAAGGETFTIESADLPGAYVGGSSVFRFMQESNNGLDLDTWYIANIEIQGGTNIFEPEYMEYNTQMLEVLEPNIDLTAIDNVNSVFYPGDAIDIEFDVTGSFPDGTTFDLLLETGFDEAGDILVEGDISAAGTIATTVPSLAPGTYDLHILSSYEEVESNTVQLVISEVLITNIAISSTDAIQVGSNSIIYPGSSIDIAYDIEGTVSVDAVINLEIYDNDLEEYILIEEGIDITNTISSTLPTGAAFYDGGDADFRLTVTNGNLNEIVMEDLTWNNTDNETTGSGQYFPLADREGYVGSNYWYNGSSQRTATSIPLDFSMGGEVDFDLRLLSTIYYEFDQEIRLEYSIDEGETWEVLETGTIINSTADIFPDNIEIPEEAWSDALLLRFIYNEDESVSSVENLIYFTGFEIYNFEEIPVATSEFDFGGALTVETLSVSLATIEDTDFVLGEEFTVEYNAVGPFPAEVEFAIALFDDSGDFYATLAEVDQTDAVQQVVNMPYEDGEYTISVLPFIRETATDVFRPDPEVIDLDEEEDFALIAGGSLDGGGEAEFDQSGDRVLRTVEIDLSGVSTATLDFDFDWDNGADITPLSTVPQLQASSDGSTFVNIPVTGSTFEDDGIIYPSMTFSVEVPAEYLTATTQFQWVQAVNLGAGNDVWSVSNMAVTVGSSNEWDESLYNAFGNDQTIFVNNPDLGNYVWEQADQTDAVFGGETFDYNWDFDPELLTETTFPSGTEFVFSINREDPATGENLIIGSSSALGTFTSETIPVTIENDTYDVLLTATVLDSNDEEIVIFDEEDIADLDIFIRAVEANYVGDANAVIYAGSDLEFEVLIENEETTGTFDDLNANLIIEYGGDRWLLASQLGTGNISATFPPFVTSARNGGDVEVFVEFSEDGPVGAVGEIIEDNPISNLTEDEDNFISGDPDGEGGVDFLNTSGRGLITTVDIDGSQLEDALLLEFDLSFDQLPEDLTNDQYLVFEYSTDGGATYTEVATFPETDAEETLDEENFRFDVLDAWKNNDTRFRWRQEEIKGDILIEDIGFTFAEVLPFDYISTTVDIQKQSLLVTNLNAEEACFSDEIVLDYEARGTFGVDNIVTVHIESLNGSVDQDLSIEFTGITSGTGSLPGFTLPTDIYDPGDNNLNFRFSLNYDDDTYSDIGEDFSGTNEPLSENSIEVVSRIDLDAEFSLSSSDLVCDGEDVIIDIDDVQNHFTYTIFDVAVGVTDPPLGSLTFDPEDGETEINLGAVADGTTLGMQVTSNTSMGTSCRTITSTYTLDIEFKPDAGLWLYNDNLEEYEMVANGQSVDVCENGEIYLSLGRDVDEANDENFSSTLIEWFRDDINTPVAIDESYISDNEINNVSGSYFARITDGACQYLTEAITVNVVMAPAKPTITITSGSLTGCEGDDPVVMEGPTGFAFYQWSTPAGTLTSRVIEAEDQGTYTLRVSNQPFSGTTSSCASNSSDPVNIERYNLSEFGISLTTSITGGDVIADGQLIDACESERIFFFDDTSYGINGGTVEVIRDGVSDGFTNSSFIDLDESGVYSFNWINDDAPIGTSCTVSSVQFTLTIFEAPDAVTITTTDVTDFCEGNGSVTLTAPAGFAQYRWLNFGSPIDSNTDGFGNTNNTITVDYAGEFSVQVSNQADGTGCFSNLSNEIDVNVRQLASDGVGVDQQGILCGPGTAVYEITSTLDDYNYQIFNNVTDLPVGPAFRGNNNGASIFVDIPVTEQTEFYVMVSYASGEGCPDPEPSTTFTVSFYDVSLELDGNNIEAVTSGGFGYDEIEWFRNGVRLQQRSGDNSIFVTDNAEYSAEVTFDDGACVIVTNTVAVEGARIQTFFGDLEASTYPNPSSDFINVDMKGGDLGAYQVSVANLSGQVMLSEEFEKTEEDDSMAVDIRSIEKGIYTLIIRKGNTVQSFRIVKQ